MDSSRNAVLSTPLLLENILLQLPMLQLLIIAPRVCKEWRMIIDDSVYLQEKLFFRDRSTVHGQNQMTTSPVRNPLLPKYFPLWFSDEPEASHTFFNEKMIEDQPFARSLAAFLRKGASWRRMLVQQPTIRRVGVLDRTHAPGGHLQKRWLHVEEGEHGLRMSEFYDLAISGIVKPSTSRRILWVGRESYQLGEEEEPEDSNLEEEKRVLYEMLDGCGPVMHSVSGVSTGQSMSNPKSFPWCEKFRGEEFKVPKLAFG